MKVFAPVLHFPSRILVPLLQLYQRAISPLLPVVFGPSCGCRFAPTCSHYAIEAVRTHGALVGSFLTMVRLIKCSPLHPGGFDPVPLRRIYACTFVSPKPSATVDTTVS